MDHEELERALEAVRVRRALPSPKRCQRLRARAGLSQGDVARALGVTREAVSYWELGKRTPRPATAAAYLVLLDRLAREQTA
jgi:transcriptional regulator with XRE-family HTH domain